MKRRIILSTYWAFGAVLATAIIGLIIGGFGSAGFVAPLAAMGISAWSLAHLTFTSCAFASVLCIAKSRLPKYLPPIEKRMAADEFTAPFALGVLQLSLVAYVASIVAYVAGADDVGAAAFVFSCVFGLISAAFFVAFALPLTAAAFFVAFALSLTAFKLTSDLMTALWLGTFALTLTSGAFYAVLAGRTHVLERMIERKPAP